MAQSSFPFENLDTSETQFSYWARNFAVNGVVKTSSSTNPLGVNYYSGLLLAAQPGQAFIRGHYYINDSLIIFSATNPDATNPRIDNVVLELDPTANTILLKYVAGTAASSPVAPALTQTDTGVYQMKLAEIYVPAGATSASQFTYTDYRNFVARPLGAWTTTNRPAAALVNVNQLGLNTSNNQLEILQASGSTYRYQPLPIGKNWLINAGFDVWQRGTSSTTVTTSGAYVADGWRVVPSGASMTVARATAAFGNASEYGLQITGATSGTNWQVQQRLEAQTVRQIKSEMDASTNTYLTASAWVYNNSGTSMTVTAATYTPQLADNWAASNLRTTGNTTIANGAWGRVILTFDTAGMINIDNGLGISFYTSSSAPLDSNTKSIIIAGAQLELGLAATPFRRQFTNIQAEVAACQRYYYQSILGSNNDDVIFGNSYSSSVSSTVLVLPCTMRAIPSASATGTYTVSVPGVGNKTFTSSVLTTITRRAVLIEYQGGSGLTIGVPVIFNGGTIAISAEL